ncbi:methyl-accepting chemotaxis protein [bacterium 1xD8-48]|jgi:methyl-accepting chemotaxis protein|nr:HAMP domain-containing protein [Lachnospiraceae bacterium]MCI9327865.1 HAMP domain-containing protein [Lachnospiraceae bacterium]NBJ98436.1 methyl-accepting chemotaxis protein [bacterium 1xD8-48]
MGTRQSDSRISRKTRMSLNGRILRNTTLNILILVAVCCVIMALSMQSLANSILLDSLQPMARQSAKTVEANIRMLAERMMMLAGDSRMNIVDIGGNVTESGHDGKTAADGWEAVLTEAAEIYEFYTIALYDLNGRLVQGIDGAPESLDDGFFAMLKETDNLTTYNSTIFQDNLGITMGMPVKENGETAFYLVGVYKYDMLNDVLSSINIGKNGMAYMVNREGIVTGHPDQSKVQAKSTLLELGGGNEEAIKSVTTGETGSTEFDIDGQQMLVAFSPIHGTQWALVIQVPKSDYNNLINGAMIVAGICTLVVLFISILVILRMARSISKPVKNVTNRMVGLSDGDLHTEVTHIRSGDELEIMTRTLAETVGSVNRYISDIHQVLSGVADGNLQIEPQVQYKGDFTLIRNSLGTILTSMNKTISGFRAAAARLARMAEELSGQSGQLHQASLEQNQATEVLVDEVTHVKEQLAGVIKSSDQTHTMTGEITRKVQEANTQMDALSNAMSNISANAQEITSIAKAIDNIAFQTNILALNASVEAARAGSAGRGFAIVAEEVKELAGKSAQAAQSAVDIVTNTKAVIQEGVELNASTAESLQAIYGVSTEISEISDQLVAAVQGQENALISMEERIATISSIADRNLQNAVGTSQSSELLAKEAEELQVQVKKFALKEE